MTCFFIGILSSRHYYTFFCGSKHSPRRIVLFFFVFLFSLKKLSEIHYCTMSFGRLLNEKELPNVICKLIRPLQGEKVLGKIRSLRQVFSNLVSPPQAQNNFRQNTVAETRFHDEERKRSLRQKNRLFIDKNKWKDNCLNDGKFSCSPPKKHISVTDIWENEIKN